MLKKPKNNRLAASKKTRHTDWSPEFIQRNLLQITRLLNLCHDFSFYFFIVYRKIKNRQMHCCLEYNLISAAA